MSGPVVTLYTKRDCPLCDEAAATLRALAAEIGFSLTEVDVEADPVLRARYGQSVPVIAIEGREVMRAPLEPAAVRAALRRRLWG